MQDQFSLFGKTVLITGASSGIGKAVAQKCAAAGATCIITARNSERLNHTLNCLDGEGHQMLIADLCKFETLREEVSNLPKLDGIVQCAGIGQRIPCKQLTEDDVNKVMDVNFKAPVLLMSEILQQKKLNKGASIVFLASIASWSGSFGNSVYSASKGAIISYANCLALELAPRAVRVNCISPAMVWTDLILKDGMSLEQLKEDESKYPLKRYGKPDDVANLAIYLLSDASSWMTGSNVKISGGAN